MGKYEDMIRSSLPKIGISPIIGMSNTIATGMAENEIWKNKKRNFYAKYPMYVGYGADRSLPAINSIRIAEEDKDTAKKIDEEMTNAIIGAINAGGNLVPKANPKDIVKYIPKHLRDVLTDEEKIFAVEASNKFNNFLKTIPKGSKGGIKWSEVSPDQIKKYAELRAFTPTHRILNSIGGNRIYPDSVVDYSLPAIKACTGSKGCAGNLLDTLTQLETQYSKNLPKEINIKKGVYATPDEIRKHIKEKGDFKLSNGQMASEVYSKDCKKGYCYGVNMQRGQPAVLAKGETNYHLLKNNPDLFIKKLDAEVSELEKNRPATKEEWINIFNKRKGKNKNIKVVSDAYPTTVRSHTLGDFAIRDDKGVLDPMATSAYYRNILGLAEKHPTTNFLAYTKVPDAILQQGKRSGMTSEQVDALLKAMRDPSTSTEEKKKAMDALYYNVPKNMKLVNSSDITYAKSKDYDPRSSEAYVIQEGESLPKRFENNTKSVCKKNEICHSQGSKGCLKCSSPAEQNIFNESERNRILFMKNPTKSNTDKLFKDVKKNIISKLDELNLGGR